MTLTHGGVEHLCDHGIFCVALQLGDLTKCRFAGIVARLREEQPRQRILQQSACAGVAAQVKIERLLERLGVRIAALTYDTQRDRLA